MSATKQQAIADLRVKIIEGYKFSGDFVMLMRRDGVDLSRPDNHAFVEAFATTVMRLGVVIGVEAMLTNPNNLSEPTEAAIERLKSYLRP